MHLSTRFILIPEICAALRYSRTSLWRLRKRDNTFPQPVQVSSQRTLFFREEFLRWAKQRQATEYENKLLRGSE